MKNLIIFLIIVSFSACKSGNFKLTSSDSIHDSIVNDKILQMVTYDIEKAYFEGQRDALNGDIRIERLDDEFCSDTIYRWIKSPWDSGEEPKFHPPLCNEKNGKNLKYEK